MVAPRVNGFSVEGLIMCHITVIVHCNEFVVDSTETGMKKYVVDFSRGKKT